MKVGQRSPAAAALVLSSSLYPGLNALEENNFTSFARHKCKYVIHLIHHHIPKQGQNPLTV